MPPPPTSPSPSSSSTSPLDLATYPSLPHSTTPTLPRPPTPHSPPRPVSPPAYPPSPRPPPPSSLNLLSHNSSYHNVEVEMNPAPVIVHPVIIYQPMPGQPHDVFYNPTNLFNQREFVMRSNIEYVLLIYPSDITEQHIIRLGHLTNLPESNINVKEEPQILCLKVKHLVDDMTMLVPVNTPLSFLLKTTKLQVRMYTIPLEEAEQCKKALHSNYLLLDLPPMNAPHRLVMFDERPSPRPSPYYIPDHSDAGGNTAPPHRPNNLLNRRFDRHGYFA